MHFFESCVFPQVRKTGLGILDQTYSKLEL